MRLNPRFAGKILIGVCSVLIIFHTTNLFGLIPANVTWLGRIESGFAKMIMAMVSIGLNIVIIICAAVKLGYVKSTNMSSLVEKALPFVFWWLVGNSIANLFSKSKFEVLAFTPLLVVLTVCVYVIKNATNLGNRST